MPMDAARAGRPPAVFASAVFTLGAPSAGQRLEIGSAPRRGYRGAVFGPIAEVEPGAGALQQVLRDEDAEPHVIALAVRIGRPARRAPRQIRPSEVFEPARIEAGTIVENADRYKIGRAHV